MSDSDGIVVLEPQTGAAMFVPEGSTLRIVTIDAHQVADVALFAADDPRDAFSPGRTIDYNERIVPSTGDVLFSHRSTPLATIVADSVGIHDVLLSPCSRTMFARRGEFDHPSCHENLSGALAPFGLGPDDVTATINVFMNVGIENNAVRIAPPSNRPGDVFTLCARCDLIAAVSACSSELTNAGSCKRIAYALDEPSPDVPQ